MDKGPAVGQVDRIAVAEAQARSFCHINTRPYSSSRLDSLPLRPSWAQQNDANSAGVNIAGLTCIYSPVGMLLAGSFVAPGVLPIRAVWNAVASP